MSRLSTSTAMRPLRCSPFRRYRRPESLTSRHYSVRVLQGASPVISTVSDLLSSKPKEDEGLKVEVDGWVRNVRKSSAVRFVDVSDGSCSTPLQAVVKKELAKE